VTINELENTRRRNNNSVAGPNTTRGLSEEGLPQPKHGIHPHGEVDITKYLGASPGILIVTLRTTPEGFGIR
jgi:hypothetical protein